MGKRKQEKNASMKGLKRRKGAFFWVIGALHVIGSMTYPSWPENVCIV